MVEIYKPRRSNKRKAVKKIAVKKTTEITPRGDRPGVLELICDGGLLGTKNPSPEGVKWSVGIVNELTPLADNELKIGVWGKMEPREKTAASPAISTVSSVDLHTNNEAEMMALIRGLIWAKELVGGKYEGTERVMIFSDSSFAIACLLGKSSSQKPHLAPMIERMRELKTELDNTLHVSDDVWGSPLHICWVPRIWCVKYLGH